MRSQRLKWFSYVEKMEEEQPAKQIFSRGVTGRKGRSRTTWIRDDKREKSTLLLAS